VILTVHNFLLDPEAERSAALKARYKKVKRNGVGYRGICRTKDDPSLFKISILLKKTVDRESVVMWRRYKENEESETYIHTDSDIADYTGILYLTKPSECQGGTAFWTHKETNWAFHPTKKELADHGLDDNAETFHRLYLEGFKDEAWKMNYYCPMEFNKLILFPSGMFHSRFPKKSFGTELGNCRLIKVFFVRCLN